MKHGGDIYNNKINLDFSVNINPLGMPKSVGDAIKNSIACVENYPDINAEKLRKKISQYHKIEFENIICGNGASELMLAIVYALMPKKIIIPVPSFLGYEHVANAIDSEVIFYEMKDNSYKLDKDFLDAIDENTDMIFLANPNNPTGEYIDDNLLDSIINKCELNNVCLVLDECFMELSSEPKRTRINNLANNLIILRAFTKSFAIPGLRLGYLITKNKNYLEKIRANLSEWNVSILAQNAGIECLNQLDYLDRGREEIKSMRKYLSYKLKKIGLKVYDSKANYILVKSEKDIYKELLKDGILIRDCSNYRGLKKGYYRIAVKDIISNEKIIKAIDNI